MHKIARLLGYTSATLVNVISDCLYLTSRGLYVRFGLWITSLVEGENENSHSS